MPVDGFNLLRPDALWLALLVLPVSLLLWRSVRRAGSWRQVIDPELLPHVLVESGGSQRKMGSSLIVLALLAAVLAAAGPSFQKIDVPVFQRADALVLVLDLSASMDAADVQPSRIRRARQKILDLLAERNEGVTGLVAYAGDAHVVAPLTDDGKTIENLLPALSPAIMPLPGSNPAAALGLAASLLQAAGVANGQIVLITDDMPKFDPGDVRDLLARANAAVSILGIGTDAGAPIPRADGGFLRTEEGEIVVPRLDARALAENAAALGGRYATVALDNTDISTLTAAVPLDQGGDIRMDRNTDTWLDQGNWIALAIAVGLLPLFRRGALAILLLAPMLALSPPADAQTGSLWQTPDQLGAQALAEGDPARAASLFEHPTWRGKALYETEDWLKAADSFGRDAGPDGWYNRGNALAKAGEFQQALEAYDKSLALEPDQADALRNRDLVNQLLQQQESQQNKQGDDGDDGDQDEGDPQDQEGSTAGSQGTDSAQQSNNDSDSAAPQQNEDSDADAADQSEGSSKSQSDAQAQGTDQSGGQSSDEGAGRGQTTADDEYREALDAQTQAQMAKFDEALEKQQALEQWLRRVPDDPGGLLKRKFRYESIQRLRRGEEPDEDILW